ncbi:MAG: hypothetical protein IH852_17365, partial [Bacteroidetes bacterium]|nr:hypothetical protein [Bacteroidota bacterium]
MNENLENGKIFTFDERTTYQLSENKIKAVNLSKYYIDALKIKIDFFERLKWEDERLRSQVNEFYYKHLDKNVGLKIIISRINKKLKL